MDSELNPGLPPASSVYVFVNETPTPAQGGRAEHRSRPASTARDGEPSSFGHALDSPSPLAASSRRVRVLPPIPNASQRGSESPTKRGLSSREKLGQVLQFIKSDVSWSLSEFLYELFTVPKDQDGDNLPVPQSILQTVTKLLQGNSKHTIAVILKLILDHPASQARRQSVQEAQMFSTAPDGEHGIYLRIKCAKAAITTLAVELVAQRLVSEVVEVVKGENGLHGSQPASRSGGRRALCWEDITAEAPMHVQGIIQKHQPLGWNLVSSMIGASGKRKVDYMVRVRRVRPVEVTTTEILTDIAYCRTPFARLNHIIRGILYFACGAQQTLFHYNSRIGHTPAWNTVVAMLKRLALLDAAKLQGIGKDHGRALILRTDNVQQYLKRRESRIGRESSMKIGMSAMASEVLDFSPDALDIDDKLRRIQEDQRKDLTVNHLLSWIDFEHAACVGALRWLQALVNYVPEFEHMKTEVAGLYRTRGAKLPLPRHRTDIYPLATVAKNENITTEFRDALLDFLGQIGQKDKAYERRLVLVGGDGLTYERMLQIKGYMLDQSDTLRRLELVEPFLETWHTGMTHLSMVNEMHWGAYLTRDPSKLGYSAAKIGQKAPSNLKKWDYYPTAWRTWLDLDMRMLDCWRVFWGAEDLFEYVKCEYTGAGKQMPTVASLLDIATTLYHRYSSHRAYEHAREGIVTQDGTFAIPEGAPWQPASLDISSADTALSNPILPAPLDPSKRRKREADAAPEEPFVGDQALADSIMLMHETILSHELAQAVAEGDPGRVYEAVKRMSFSFAGSSHTKYAGYTLEMIVNHELESSPALQQTFLKNWLINPSGEPGRWVEGDLHLEHINLILETMIEHKDAEWDDTYVRTVVAPNVSHFVTLKNTYRDGLGLGKRRGAHTSPHCRPEVSTLLAAFKEDDIHRFRRSRHYGASPNTPPKDLDLFAQGVVALREGKLEKWKSESRAHRMHYNKHTETTETVPGLPAGGDDEGDDGEEGDEDEHNIRDLESGTSSLQTDGMVVYKNGELIVDYGGWTASDALRTEGGDDDILEE